MHTLYHPPLPADPLLPDLPHETSPSDHLGNLHIPRSVPGVKGSRVYRKIVVRPFSDSQIAALGRWISTEPLDLELLKRSKSMVSVAKKNFSENFISSLKETDPSTWMKRMNKLGMASFERENAGWHFLTEDSSDQSLTDGMADYFANISNNFPPVNASLLNLVPPTAAFVSEVPCLPSEVEVFGILQAAKKTSSVPQDFPSPFLKEFLPFLAKPAMHIFSQAVIEGVYPTRWKTEYVTPHPKTLPPVTFGDLRNLSLTEFLSKSFERFLLKGTHSVKGLLHYITKYYDPGQYAVPGASCSHALISIINFILKSTDDPNKPTAVVNLLADWSKAFNKVNHNIIMRILIALKIPQ
jgi:hypothetical protein